MGVLRAGCSSARLNLGLLVIVGFGGSLFGVLLLGLCIFVRRIVRLILGTFLARGGSLFIRFHCSLIFS